MRSDRTKIVLASLMFILALAVPALAHAQIRSLSPSGFLLIQPAVRKELALDTEQEAKVDKSVREFTQDMGDGRLAIRLTPDMDINAIDRALVESLKEEQKKRLRELWIQYNKGRILADESIQKELELTAKQKEQLDDVRAWYQDEVQAIVRESNNGQITITEELQNSLSEKNLAVLTADQKKKLEDMKGKPFEFKKKKKD